MATMADVAAQAGVSISTVSHVLNGTRKVSPATLRAVQHAMEAVGYTPSILARALARSTTNTIGLALSAVSNHYFSEIVRAAGRRVPEDVALVGFDDFDWAECFSPRLTVMAQPCEQIGTRAADLLMRRPADPDGARQTLRLRPALRLRNSCGCR